MEGLPDGNSCSALQGLSPWEIAQGGGICSGEVAPWVPGLTQRHLSRTLPTRKSLRCSLLLILGPVFVSICDFGNSPWPLASSPAPPANPSRLVPSRPGNGCHRVSGPQGCQHLHFQTVGVGSQWGWGCRRESSLGDKHTLGVRWTGRPAPGWLQANAVPVS